MSQPADTLAWVGTRIIHVPADIAGEMLACRSGVDLYDFEIDGTYHVAPAPSGKHARVQARIGWHLTNWADRHGLQIMGPLNLGILTEDRRAYVVPDVTVLPGNTPDATAYLRAVIAVEVLSPTEDEAAKVDAYRQVVELTGLQLDELWHVDPAAESVHIYRDGALVAGTQFDLDPAELLR